MSYEFERKYSKIAAVYKALFGEEPSQETLDGWLSAVRDSAATGGSDVDLLKKMVKVSSPGLDMRDKIDELYNEALANRDTEPAFRGAFVKSVFELAGAPYNASSPQDVNALNSWVTQLRGGLSIYDMVATFLGNQLGRDVDSMSSGPMKTRAETLQQ